MRIYLFNYRKRWNQFLTARDKDLATQPRTRSSAAYVKKRGEGFLLKAVRRSGLYGLPRLTIAVAVSMERPESMKGRNHDGGHQGTAHTLDNLV